MTPPGSRSSSDARPEDLQHTLRIGRAWIELRRGAGSVALREFLYGQDHVLEQGQMDALDVLSRRERTMRGLADRMRIDPSSATRAVQRLEQNCLAERYRSPEDGRVVMVRITAEGRRRRDPVAKRRALTMGRIMSAFDADEREQLADLLDRLTESIDRVVEELRKEE